MENGLQILPEYSQKTNILKCLIQISKCDEINSDIWLQSKPFWVLPRQCDSVGSPWFDLHIDNYVDIVQTSRGYLQQIPHLLPLAHISLTGSIYFTLSISLERYNTVCRPFHTVSTTDSW